MKILLVGGGSGGPVAPLLAVAEEIKKRHFKAEFLLVGTKTGPERLMAQTAGIRFAAISAGKWRRYFSLANLSAPFLVLTGFLQARKIIKTFRPDCVFGAGSFVQVPVVWAAKFFGVPVVLHQQDVRPSLANALCQGAATKITVSFRESLSDFSSGLGLFYKKPENKIELTGNPVRAQIKAASREEGIKHFHLKPDFPTLLALGGGTGAQFINRLVAASLPQLVRVVQVIHSTGPKKAEQPPRDNYHPFEFIADMGQAYAAADIVLCRAGMSTITELSVLKKVSIIVPIPKSHQEDNALLLFGRQAAVVLPQLDLMPDLLLALIRKLLFDIKTQHRLSENIGEIMPHGGAAKIAEIVETLAIKHN